ncbi:MAG TPA: hypothetical protein P5567_10360 [Kiritimatiellia bacterium]|nr:hypothetical protein [Kiritimatiellia bacterium]HRZ12841.1 hypothetical protein [Kiritimatiellia bacterium]HSA18207.1 hypothetical protein [Kiritimatiellia bacterium]
MMSRILTTAVLLFLWKSASSWAGPLWGRSSAPAQPSAYAAGMLGQVTTLDGYVQETTRPFYDITDPGKNDQFAESYTLEELGFDGGYATFGFSFEKQWRFFTLQANLSYLSPAVRGEAVRDYYIGVEDVSYNGETYDYMHIPEGAPFEAEMQGGSFAMRGLATPVSITAGRAVEITPSLGLGLNTFFSYFEIDAGPAQGVVLYEIPPREYVVGGRGKGWTGMVLPELGAGLDVRFGGGTAEQRAPELLLQAYFALLDFSGSTEDFGISSRNAKDVDLEYDHFEARALVGIPMSKDLELLLGVGVQHMKADAEVMAEDRPAEEVEELREKFNKFIQLEMTTVTFLAGLRF